MVALLQEAEEDSGFSGYELGGGWGHTPIPTSFPHLRLSILVHEPVQSHVTYVLDATSLLRCAGE